MTWTSPGWWITSRSLVFCRVPAASRRQSWQLSTSGPKGPGRRLRRRVPVNPGRRAGDAAREVAAGRAWRRATGDLPPRIPPEACVGSRLKRRCDSARRPRPRPRRFTSRPGHRDASKAASAGMASRLCLETGRLKAAGRGPEKHGYSGGIFLRRLWAKKMAGDMLSFVSRSF